MSEIEKLYKNAGVNKETECNEPYDVCSENGECDICFYANNYYPPFTPQKQLELICWLSRRYIEISNYDAENGRMYNIKPTVGDFATSFNYDFSECIAGLINNLWQDLTTEEQEQIKKILEGKQ